MATGDIIKNAIAEGAKELIRENGIEEITVTQICDKVGINRRNFYRYFRDKFEVVDWIYYHDALISNSPHYEGWSIFDYMQRIMESLYADPKYYLNVLKYQGQNSFREYSTANLRRLIEADYAKIFPEPELLDLFVTSLCDLTYDVCIWWLSQEPIYSPVEITAIYKSFLVRSSQQTANLLVRSIRTDAKKIDFKPPEPGAR